MNTTKVTEVFVQHYMYFFPPSILYSHHDNNNANMQKAAAKLNYTIATILAS